MENHSLYAAPADDGQPPQSEEIDPFLAQYGFDPNRERVRWPHQVGASYLGLNAVFTFVLISMGERRMIIWPLVDLTLAIGALLKKKKIYANFAAIRGGSMILIGAPILFFVFNPIESIFTLIFGTALVCLCWGQPHAIRAWIGSLIGGLYLALFTLGLVFYLIGVPNF